MFKESLEKAMQELHINQAQVCGMTGCSKGSISQYLSGKNVPSDQKQRDIAVSLGLDQDYFFKESAAAAPVRSSQIRQISVDQAAKLMRMNHNTVRKGLQQGVFPWGYGIHTSENRWVYFINAERFGQTEGVSI